MSKRTFWTIVLSVVTIVPVVLYVIARRTINVDKVLDNLYLQFDGISFVSVDYNNSNNESFGQDKKVLNGVVHVEQGDKLQKYNFTANKYTGEIMEITVQ
ncbi:MULTISPECIES: hypothetical protein [Nosocomiicoccus]|uniref:DUF3139 domain-containing protein n=1 Tax=Nosocomiicoccus massiliensis TaxID=1232430 RepID=A0AAF0YM05_9STAP|nr:MULTISPECIES: hypothetical protein [Nosocomiicoccus]MDK6863224.1 hypothetical protein [Nosocomiicoccus ampullae]OFL46295.1 hypothetical protein HMPREF2767_05135 [Nosocomiicoccus sp. HMSC067E10]OFO53697.1 hypothetical protein HMPREF3029_05340 [Nosocomiicoccus sp. HMSC059G07]OFS63666.1 hypothetical protein HMPREF3177_02485 [Nosocomiicoccus sp. HMSC09A07]WOS96715.1 hypothetical protein CJ229_002935 [Nosocomiicoccus massiliensis]